MLTYIIIGKQKCIQCDELHNLLDEKRIQYNFLDSTKHESFIFKMRGDLNTF
jgi:glutaredoxin